MPTYRNNTKRRITHADMSYMEWQPGEEKRLPFFVPHEELGLTLVSDQPAVNSVARSWVVTLIPGEPLKLKLEYLEAFELSVFSESGSAAMRIGDSGDEVIITAASSHFSSYSYARCPYLTFVPGEDEARLIVKQEERNTRNTLRRGIC
jgi:hypothetical protein